jgi:AmmeMemoRadiSam system protein A
VVDAETRRVLLDAALEAVRTTLATGERLDPPLRGLPDAAVAEGASFVTLRRGERLLGCIGTIEPIRSLVVDVAHNAIAAAFDDPRLPPLTRDDFAHMSLKVSVLSPLEPLAVDSFDELRARVTPGSDGLLVVAGHHRGTFLPSVWDQVPALDEFLESLWRKAGLAPGRWPADLAVWRYRTDEFGDDGPRPFEDPSA